MMIIVLYGSRLDAEPYGEGVGLCGWCLEEGPQTLCALKQRFHVYYVPLGEELEVGRVTTCHACRRTSPLVEREDATREEALVDAFLDAHDAPLGSAEASPLVGLGCGGLVALAAVVVGIVGYLVENPLWLLPTFFVVAFAGLVAGQLVRTRIGHWIFGGTADAKVARLITLTGWTIDDLADRADERGYLRLRDFLASRAL